MNKLRGNDPIGLQRVADFQQERQAAMRQTARLNSSLRGPELAADPNLAPRRAQLKRKLVLAMAVGAALAFVIAQAVAAAVAGAGGGAAHRFM